MKQMEKQPRIIFLPLLIGFCCLFMFAVEVFWQPGYWGKSLLKLVAFALLPLFYCLLATPKISLRFCKITERSQLKYCLLWGGAVFAIILCGYAVFAALIDLPQIATILQQNLAVNKDNFLFVAIYISLVNSFLEEFFFRGVAYFPLVDILGKKKAALFASLAFSLYHVAILLGWFSVWLFFLILLGLFAAGLFFIWLDETYQTIFASWLVHGCANLAINTIGFLMFAAL